jgi:hypothetical protein
MTRSTKHDQVVLAATLARQYQVVSRAQAMALGMTTSALRQRLRPGGPWQRLLPGPNALKPRFHSVQTP